MRCKAKLISLSHGANERVTAKFQNVTTGDKNETFVDVPAGTFGILLGEEASKALGPVKLGETYFIDVTPAPPEAK